jgi:hypothetical protein
MATVAPNAFIAIPAFESIAYTAILRFPFVGQFVSWAITAFHRTFGVIGAQWAIRAAWYASPNMKVELAQIESDSGNYTHADYGGRATLGIAISGMGYGLAASMLYPILVPLWNGFT